MASWNIGLVHDLLSVSTEPLPEQIMAYCQSDPMKHISLKIHLNLEIDVQENVFESGFCKMPAILFWAQCVNSLRPSDAYMRQ